MGTALIAECFGTSLTGVPKLLLSFIVVVLCFLVGGALLGPISILPLGVISALHFGRSVLPGGGGNSAAGARRAIKMLGAAALVAIIGAALMSFWIHAQRTQGQYIVRWEGTGPAQISFDKLRKNEPQSLDDYRYIVAHGKRYMVSYAAQRIAELGDPAIDVAILEDALSRMSSEPNSDYGIERIELALKQLRTKGKEIQNGSR